MTYSIVARDPETGELGVAVQTCMFAVGSVVPWARPGVGAVATQAIGRDRVRPALSRRDDERRRARSTRSRSARAADPADAMRQVGVVDASGISAAFTGDLCIDHAGHRCAEGYAVQANMMASPEVWPAMAAAYEARDGRARRSPLRRARRGRERGRRCARPDVGRAARRRRNSRRVAGRGRADQPARRRSPATARRAGAADARRGRVPVVRRADGRADGRRSCRPHYARSSPRSPSCPTTRTCSSCSRARSRSAGAPTRRVPSCSKLVAHRPSWVTILQSFADKGLITLPEGVDIDFVRRVRAHTSRDTTARPGGRPPMPKLDPDVEHSPVVVKTFEKRAADAQLRLADRDHGVRGLDDVRLGPLRDLRVVDRVGTVRRRPLSVPVPHVRRVARSDLLVDVRDDRSEPPGGVPAGEGRPRLPRAGDRAEGEHRAHADDSRADTRAAPEGVWRPQPAAGE